jgi:hypothetical protein
VARATRKGRAVCASELHLPAEDTERQILDRVERELLNADLFGVVLDPAVQRLTREAPERCAVTTERERLDRELGNSGLPSALGAKLTEWKRLLRSRPTHGQTVLRTCSTDSRGYAGR